MNSINKILKPFSIVTAPYTDLTGEVKSFFNGDIQKGLFLVLRADDNGNVLAAKITSQSSPFLNRYCHLLTQYDHSFLKADSYVQLDKLHTLANSECTVLGTVHYKVRESLINKFNSITHAITNALKDNLSFKNYSSPNSRNNPRYDNNSRYDNNRNYNYNQGCNYNRRYGGR